MNRILEWINSTMKKALISIKRNSPGFFMILVGLIMIPFFMNGLSRIIGSPSWLPSTNTSDFFKYGEAAVAVIAALLLGHQLRKEAESEAKEALLEQSSFIKDFNFAYLSKELTNVERELEGFYTSQGNRKSITIGEAGSETRQKYINYLVYLESLATVIHNGAMTIEHIDSLMGYRFFVAVNNEILQDNELIPYAIHYRGIFRLYEEWVLNKYEQCWEAAKDAKKACKEERKKLEDQKKKLEKQKTDTGEIDEKIKDVEKKLMGLEKMKNLLKKIKKDPKELEGGSLFEVVKGFETIETNNPKLRRLLVLLKDNPEDESIPIEWLATPQIMDSPLCGKDDDTKNRAIYEAVLGYKSRVPMILQALQEET